ncbi:hypothetical protein BDQ17DRAFT_1435092 [Cyathus striatus]|nr:hypothetical protein BDQ17DRAFT_1435092 [Cyathus striatus]
MGLEKGLEVSVSLFQGKRDSVCIQLISSSFGIHSEFIIETGPENHKKTAHQSSEKVEITHTPVFTKEIAALSKRIEIMDWHHQSTHKSQVKTASHWEKVYPNLRLNQSTISDWLKHEVKWRAQWAEAQAKGQARTTKQAKQAEFPEVNDILELWIAMAMEDDVSITAKVIKQSGASLLTT